VKPPKPVLLDTLRHVPGSWIDYVHPALDLVNSQHGRAPDLLDDERWLNGFLQRWGHARVGRLSRREREPLIALRTLLRRIVETIDAGGEASPRDLGQLNRVLGAVTVSRRLVAADGTFDVRLVPARRDWAWVRSDLAASFAELLARGESARFKICDNPDCRFAFYDASKNRSRRWCAQTTCGNRHKVRQFRARQRLRTDADAA
jgi:predicted RNA-binding Zn ribbon-like protein